MQEGNSTAAYSAQQQPSRYCMHLWTTVAMAALGKMKTTGPLQQELSLSSDLPQGIRLIIQYRR